jgi:hypothetical protein
MYKEDVGGVRQHPLQPHPLQYPLAFHASVPMALRSGVSAHPCACVTKIFRFMLLETQQNILKAQ